MYPFLIAIHIAMGAAGLVSGAAALALRKGSGPHRAAGTIFFISMLIMAALGAIGGAFVPERLTSLNGVLAFYFVATGWVTIKRGDGESGFFEIAALLVVAIIAMAQLFFGIVAAGSASGMVDGFPAAAYFIFGSVAIFAALLDIRVIAGGGVSGIHRIGRHLWRMCFALFLAASAFFLGQEQVFPEALQGTIWLALPVLIVLALMVFWIFRVRFSKAWAGDPVRAAP